MHRKIGIIDPVTGGIIFVSREEGYSNIRKSAERPAVQIPVDAVEKEIAVEKSLCPCTPG